MDFRLFGILFVFFGRRFSFQAGAGKWLVPMIQIVIANHVIMWNGFMPFGIIMGDMDYIPITFAFVFLRSDVTLSTEEL